MGAGAGGEGEVHGLVVVLPRPEALLLLVQLDDAGHVLVGAKPRVHQLERVHVLLGQLVLFCMRLRFAGRGARQQGLRGRLIAPPPPWVVREVVINHLLDV